MSRSHHRWLPEAALKACGLDRDLADACRQWSIKWLAQGALRPMATVMPIDGVWPAADRARLLNGDLALFATGGAGIMLAAAMLDRTIDANALSPADTAMIEALAETALDDLAARLAQIFGLPMDSRWSEQDPAGFELDRPRGCALTLDQRKPLLHVFATTDAMVALARRGIPAPPKGTPLSPMAVALGDQSVALSAMLGACELRVADVAQLAPGDVLVLDRELGSALPLALDHWPIRAGRCAVEQAGDRLHLELLEPLK